MFRIRSQSLTSNPSAIHLAVRLALALGNAVFNTNSKISLGILGIVLRWVSQENFRNLSAKGLLRSFTIELYIIHDITTIQLVASMQR